MSVKLKTPQVIDEVMTPCPECIKADSTCEQARDMMSKIKVRHLPVTDNNKVIGIVSHRDLQFALGWSGKSGKSILVSEIMNDEPFIVSTGTSVYDVLRRMADDRIGSALIEEDDGELVGIFTSTDACDILAELLL